MSDSSTTHPSLSRRAGAAVALVALGGAVTVIVVTLVRDPVELAVALLLLALAVAAGWAAAVGRGPRRALAAAGAFAALLGVVALPDVRTLVVSAVLVGLMSLASLTARAALGAGLGVGPATRPVGPARRGVLLMNPRSGGGKVALFDLVNEASRRGITPVLLGPDDDLRTLAEQAAEDGDVIGMAGGDGSQALVADVARRHGIPFVCVPAGTRNHFALDLGLDRDDVVAALDAFGDAAERVVDLAVVGDRVFVNNASLGVYAAVVRSPGYRDAKVTTVADKLPELLGPDADRFDLRFPWPAGADRRPADLVLVSNGDYRLDRLSGFGTRGRLDGGHLGIVAVTVDRARDLPALIAAEISGQLALFPGYRAWRSREFVVDSGQLLIDVGVDGEALRLRPPLRFRSLPGALRVRVPLGAHGRAPSPRLRRSVGALFRVLAGIPASRPTRGEGNG
ncbi:diacylglycerol/lipid kinase family protein [Actinophytocola sp.]|uniref:diacylglycerol/lipid kinase family protein n=1 Tax=Actinophytocola sp. TaxID=1872138 RepID=UPI00389B32F5